MPLSGRISVHALRKEGDLEHLEDSLSDLEFLSTPSAGRATLWTMQKFSWPGTFLSTPSARRATRSFPPWPASRQISIHALRKEGDSHKSCWRHHLLRFLSTPSARRATEMFALTVVFSPFLSTPSARRATFNRPCHIHLFLISIHALRKEGDGDGRERMISDIEFLSTPSARRATGVVFTEPNHNGDFYPRPPQGGRRGAPPFALSKNYFYPRPPQGGRQGSLIVKGRHADFYPRPPQGGRPLVGRKGALQKTFLSTPSARRATGALVTVPVGVLFLSTPSARRATEAQTD